MFSTLAIAMLALLANPAPVVLAQNARPPVVAPVQRGRGIMVTGTGWGTNNAAADAAALTILTRNMNRASTRNGAIGDIEWGPTTTTRVTTGGYWLWSSVGVQSTMTATSKN